MADPKFSPDDKSQSETDFSPSNSDDSYLSDELLEIQPAEEDSAINDLIKDINQTILDTDINLEHQTTMHEAGSTYNDTSTMSDEEFQKILSASNVSIEENSNLDALSGDLEQNNASSMDDEELRKILHADNASIENIEQDTSMDLQANTGIRAEENESNDPITASAEIVSSIEKNVENIVEDILKGYSDPATENETQDYEEPINPDENNYTSTIAELTTMVDGIEPETNFYSTPSNEEQHESIAARIETLWAELAEVWPAIQKQPHVVAKIEELWGILKQTDNDAFGMPSEFEQFFQDTNANITSSEYEVSGVDINFENHITTNENDNVLQLANYRTQTNQSNNSHSYIDETVTNSVPFDDELGELVASILGKNPEADETIFQESTFQTNFENTIETKWSSSLTDESEDNQINSEEPETVSNTASANDELDELVLDILSNNIESDETPYHTENETNSNTTDSDTTDEVDAILKKYTEDEENLLDVKTEPEIQESGTTPSNDKFVVDEELQKILGGTTDPDTSTSKTSDKIEDYQSDLPSNNGTITSVPTLTTTSTTTLKKTETVSRSTPRTSATKSTHTTNTQGKAHINETSGPDTSSSGWKWALASLVPIAVITMLWSYLGSDDVTDQQTPSANNMALYKTKNESRYSSSRDNGAESIEDIIKRLTEIEAIQTETIPTIETVPLNENSPEPIQKYNPEFMQTETTTKAVPFTENNGSEISSADTMGAGTANELTAPPMAMVSTDSLSQSNEQNLLDLTDHIRRLEATISDLQQTTANQVAAVTQAQEAANILPVEQITQLIDVPVANLQQGVDQRFMELGARITRLEAAVAELQKSALLLKQDVLRQNATNENNASAVISQGNQQQINTLTQRLSEIESSLQDQAARISNNESAQILQQKALQQKILSGDKATANNTSVALLQSNQQQIQSLTHRISKVESSLQNHAADISHTQIIMSNTPVTAADTGAAAPTSAGTGQAAQIEKDSSGVTITLNRPATIAGQQTGINNKYLMITHIIVKGDTLWAIAKRYVKNPYLYPELARLSNIKNPDLIYPGNRVRIIQFID